MIEYNIEDIVPEFILADRNGYAMAKAMEAGLNYFLSKCQEGMDAVMDIDKMPEWRLDEMAWEYNCLYDYKADINAKRGWIKNAYDYYKYHGTAEGIRQYLGAYFVSAHISEWYEADLNPGYFDVVVSGNRSPESEAWVRASVEKAKNVRSILHNIVFYGGEIRIPLNNVLGFSGLSVVEKVRMGMLRNNVTIGDIEDMEIGVLQQKDIRMIQK